MINALRLDRYRKKLKTSFDKTMTVLRSTSTNSGLGESVVWSKVVQPGNKTSVPCSVATFGQQVGREQVTAERLTGEKLWSIYCPVGTDVTTSDQVQIGADIYEVREVRGKQESNQVQTTITGVLVE